MKYAELHCHSCFSLLDGAALPEVLVARAKELGLHALAITDHDELGGSVRFATAAFEAEIPGIIGAELTVQIGDGDDELTTHLPLLAETREGYGNLSTLVTLGRKQARGSPFVTLDQLASHSRGLFALTGCPRGWVTTLATAGRMDAACEAAADLMAIFGRDHIAVECWDHGLPEERETTSRLIEIAHALEIPWVVTNDVHYARARDRMVHDVLVSLRHKLPLDQMGTRLRPNSEWYLKGAAQIARRSPSPTSVVFVLTSSSPHCRPSGCHTV